MRYSLFAAGKLGSSDLESAESWNNRLPGSLMDSISPSKTPPKSSTSPQKQSTSPAKNSVRGDGISSSGFSRFLQYFWIFWVLQETELQRREALEKRLAEEMQKEQQKKKKKKLKI